MRMRPAEPAGIEGEAPIARRPPGRAWSVQHLCGAFVTTWHVAARRAAEPAMPVVNRLPTLRSYAETDRLLGRLGTRVASHFGAGIEGSDQPLARPLGAHGWSVIAVGRGQLTTPGLLATCGVAK